MNFEIRKAKYNEVHTDTIRVFQDKRRYYSSGGEIIKSGSLCKVRDVTTGEFVYAILRGLELDEKEYIKIDESLRQKLGINTEENEKIIHQFTFHKTSFFEKLYWMWSTTDYGYRISSKIAIISLVLGVLSIFNPLNLIKSIFSLFSFNLLIDISPEKLSSILSIIVALVILCASFFQWWNITWNGGMLTKIWVKFIFVFCIILLIISLFLII